MKHVKRITLLQIFMICVSVMTVWAGNDSKRGAAGGLEVLLPVGARGQALGGANLATTSGIEAIHWNPAGVGKMNGGGEALFSHTKYFADIGLNYGAVAINAEGFGAIALSVKTVDFGTIFETTEDFPEGTGATFNPVFSVIGLTYSRMLTDRISVGATVKLVNESIARTSATGFGFDAGVQYSFASDSPLKGVKFAVALKNLGPTMQYDGADLERTVDIPDSDPNNVPRPLRFASQAFELPATLDLGISYDYTVADVNRFTINTIFQNSNFGSDEYRAGIEYAFSEQIFLRGGYSYVPTVLGDALSSIFGLSAGAGFNLDLGGMQVRVDYAYRDTEFFLGTNTFAVQLNF
jgi:opacity protein-like surface antigen